MNSNQDVEQLKLLSIFQYVVAGILAVFSMFPLIHLAIGIAIVTGQFDNATQGPAPPELFGWLFIFIAALGILCGLMLAACVALLGRRLRANTNYLYCLIVAGIECCFMPFGTVLGVFTIIVLSRPSVKTRFDVPQK